MKTIQLALATCAGSFRSSFCSGIHAGNSHPSSGGHQAIPSPRPWRDVTHVCHPRADIGWSDLLSLVRAVLARRMGGARNEALGPWDGIA